jgi:pilus assembly protein CpaC
VLGALFRSSEYRKNETELVIIITPHLVKPLDMAKQTLPTDGFKEPTAKEFFLHGKMEGASDKKELSLRSAPEKDAKGGFDGPMGRGLPPAE